MMECKEEEECGDTQILSGLYETCHGIGVETEARAS